MAGSHWFDFCRLLWYVISDIYPRHRTHYLPIGLALWEFNKRRIQFSQFLKSNSSLTLSRYFRLMALAMTEMISTTPLAVFVIYLNATSVPIGPWISWDDTHFGYSRIDQVPSLIWRSNGRIAVAMELTRWLAPLCALVFFSFFGFAQEAQKQYRAVYLYLKKSTTSRKTTSKYVTNSLSSDDARLC